MAEDSDHLADGLESETAVEPIGFLAEEKGFDRHVLWRLASWGCGAVGAVTVAILANQSSIGLRHDALASADLTRQAQQVKSIVGENQTETRRLSSAIDTLNADRDRLYSRVTVLEQGLDTVTGSISRQIRAPALAQTNATPPSGPEASAGLQKSGAAVASSSPDKMAASQSEPVAQAAAPVLSTPPAATSAATSKPAVAASEPTVTKPAEPEAASASAPATPDIVASNTSPEAETPARSPAIANIAIQRTDFAVDVGGASSLEGLRALWRVLIKSNSTLKPLQPIVVVKENHTGLGMQLRLVAGPIGDAAAAAKICATLSESNRPCETTVFDGQRLALKGEPAIAMRPSHRRIARKPPPSTLSFFGR